MVKRLLQLSIVALSVGLALVSWFAALMPFWLTQSGDQGDTGAYYSQGLGLWLNYTEHAGDAGFDPGNSLWVPPQRSAAQSYADQCAASRGFCDGATGQLKIQYCEVMDVYCGAATTVLQLAMSAVAGLAVLVVVWAVKSIAVTHRTAADRFLMHLCVVIGVVYLGVVVLWYFAVYRVVLDTTFYKDQYNRCNENPADRKCWQVGFCVYLAIAGGILYPLLSLMVVNHVTDKFRRYQRLLRRLFESATMVDLPDPMVTLKAESLGDDPLASADVAIELETQLRSQTLQPLRTLPSAVRHDQSEIEIDDSIDEIDDSEHTANRLKASSPATGSHHVAV